MANNKVILKKGSGTSLPEIEAGSLIFATDTGQTYLDVSDRKRIELRDTSKVSVEELTNQVSAAKKHSDIFDVQYLSTTSTSSPIVCTPVFSSQKDSSITADDIAVEGAILFIKFNMGYTSTSSDSSTIFQIGTKTLTASGKYNCVPGDVAVVIIGDSLNNSSIIGTIPDILFEAGKGLNLTGRIFTHNDFLTVGSKDTTYGGGSQVSETSQTIDLSTGSATFKVPKIKPGELGHVSEIEDYTITFSKIDAPLPAVSNTIPVYSVTGHTVDNYQTNLISPINYTLGDAHQLLVIEFMDGNNQVNPAFEIEGINYFCGDAVPTWNNKFSALFLIPDTTIPDINYIGAFDNSPSYDGVILQYDIEYNKVNHSKQLKTGSTTVDYGGITFSTAGELTNGDTFSIPKIKVDEYGHVVSISEDESVLSVDISGNGIGIKEFVYDAAHSSSDNLVYNSLIPGTTIEVNDLLLLDFDDSRILLGDSTIGTLNNIPFKLVFGNQIVNKDSKALFRVSSVSSSQISVGNIGEIAPVLLTPSNSALTIDSDISTGRSINHKELLTTGTPGTTYGDLVTGTDLKKTINLPKVVVDKYGHVVNIQETSVNANFREDTLTDQTSAQYRNIVVVPPTTDLSTLDVPVGTIIFVKN